MPTVAVSGLIQPSASSIAKITSLTASRDIATITAAFKARYNMDAPEQFVRDFIAFVEALTDGQQ